MTGGVGCEKFPDIIPYQELLGNYDPGRPEDQQRAIIPYQELLGNYDNDIIHLRQDYIIPYQELLGNYDNVRPL